jgi:hypothetical protein
MKEQVKMIKNHTCCENCDNKPDPMTSWGLCKISGLPVSRGDCCSTHYTHNGIKSSPLYEIKKAREDVLDELYQYVLLMHDPVSQYSRGILNKIKSLYGDKP